MKIKAAAIRRGNKIVATGISHQDAKLSAGGVAGEHGFLTDAGLVVDRMRAAEIALSSGQAKEISDPDLGLSSSDLEYDYPIGDQTGYDDRAAT
jgi:hypothetical protein